MKRSLAPLLVLALLETSLSANSSPAEASEHAPAPAAPTEAHSTPAEPAVTAHEEPKHAEETAPTDAHQGHAQAPEKKRASVEHDVTAYLPATPPKHDRSSSVQALTEEEIASVLRIAEAASAKADFQSAEIGYRQVLSAHAKPEQDRQSLLGLARIYRRQNELTKAAAVYEKLLKEFPGDAILPTVYLELGRTQRALGAYRLAIGRFYSVINSTLKLPENGADAYRQLARTAQFEIAETHFMSGDYAEAARFYTRLKLLDLAPVDRARAHFKSLYAHYLGGDYEKAASGLKQYLDQNPLDENVPEARYLLSVALRRLNRNQESLAVAIDLLKSEQARDAADPKRWAYWQRKTGNQLANEFYEQGDASSALAIYTNLASIDATPGWRLPVYYQIGLCYERLRSDDRAREFYGKVIEGSKTGPASPEITGLADMAAWRLKHLDWQQSTDRQISTFFQTPVHISDSTPATLAAPESADTAPASSTPPSS